MDWVRTIQEQVAPVMLSEFEDRKRRLTVFLELWKRQEPQAYAKWAQEEEEATLADWQWANGTGNGTFGPLSVYHIDPTEYIKIGVPTKQAYAGLFNKDTRTWTGVYLNKIQTLCLSSKLPKHCEIRVI